MNKVMLMYPPGKLYQRSEDRAQCNISESATGAVHACNDLGYCAAVLLEKGYHVFLRDYQTEGADFGDVHQDVCAFQPDMIVLSTTNSSVKDDLAFLKKIQRFHPCICVLKGALFYDIDTALLSTLDLQHIACLIGTEMEFVIAPLADYYLRAQGDIAAIDGILYQKETVWIKNKFTCACNDLDALPFPARQLMKNELYVRPDTGEAMATIQTGLGCPSKCIYCLTPIISGNKVRHRSVDSIFREIEECYYKFGIKNFFFKADTFTIDEAFAAAVCDRIIQSDLHGKIAFTANSRVKPLHASLLKKMKQAGCFMLAVGFESGCNVTLKKIKKGTTVADNLRAAKLIHKAGIPLFGFFMIGFPWETEAMIRQTERHIHQIQPDFIELHIAMPYYKTGLYELCDAYGVLADSGFGHDYYAPNTTGTRYLSAERVEQLKRRILLGFYLRPAYVVQKMGAAVKQPKVIGSYMRYGFSLLHKNLLRKK